MSNPSPRKIGGVDVIVSLDFLKLLREKATPDAVAAWTSYEEFSKSIIQSFPGMALRTLSEYVSVVSNASDFIFGLAIDGKISIGTLKVLCKGELDSASRDTLASAVISKSMTTGQVNMVKRLIKSAKGRMSMAEAIMRATGEIPMHAKPEHAHESMKTFGKIVGKVVDSSIRFMTDLQVAMDLLPHSAIANGESYMGVYEKIDTFEVALENSLHFVRERKKRFFESLKQHIMIEAEMDQRRIAGGDRP